MSLKAINDLVRQKKPLVHCITNAVTINDCANAVLAVGGSPVMADIADEVNDFVDIADALVINIGTPSPESIQSMLRAARRAKERGVPLIVDPVGLGASKLRDNLIRDILKTDAVWAIRGNASEIKALLGLGANTRGVDASGGDAVSEKNIREFVSIAMRASKLTNAVVAMTGAIDVVADGKTAYLIYNGNTQMTKICGTGCMLSAISGAYVGANRGDVTGAMAAAVCMMGVSGERAFENGAGLGSARVRLFDYLGGDILGARIKRVCDYGLYLIIDERVSDAAIEQAVSGGVGLVQLRVKGASTAEYAEIAKRYMRVTDSLGVGLIVNDDAEAAARAGALGVHLGQGDGSVAAARAILGENAIIGVSANTVELAKSAQKSGADYIGAGAAFETASKSDVDVIGVEKIAQIASAVDIPVVAIGGINKGNIKRLSGSGVAGVSVISAILHAPDIKKAASELTEW